MSSADQAESPHQSANLGSVESTTELRLEEANGSDARAAATEATTNAMPSEALATASVADADLQRGTTFPPPPPPSSPRGELLLHLPTWNTFSTQQQKQLEHQILPQEEQEEATALAIRGERIRWTIKLHAVFERALAAVGGAAAATPKAVLDAMAVPGLTLLHVKSHLQKVRRDAQMAAAAREKEEREREEEEAERGARRRSGGSGRSNARPPSTPFAAVAGGALLLPARLRSHPQGAFLPLLLFPSRGRRRGRR